VAEVSPDTPDGSCTFRGERPEHRVGHYVRSILEAVLCRGDRRLGAGVEAAWRAGARMDAWDETFRYDLWQQAFEQTGLDPAFYAHRQRPFDEILPWDHIASGATRAHLESQYNDVFVQLSQRTA
jgi:hypothetical protein